MDTIGVLQLDQPSTGFEHPQHPDSLEAAIQQYMLLQQCHSVSQWIVMANQCDLVLLEKRLGRTDKHKFLETPGQDALDTFYRAAERFLASAEAGLKPHVDSVVVRVRPGPSQIEAKEIDAVLGNHIDKGFDYSRNNMLDDGPAATIEIINLDVLNEAWREALLPDDRDLITPYITRQHQRLNLGTFNVADIGQSSRNRIDSIHF